LFLATRAAMLVLYSKVRHRTGRPHARISRILNRPAISTARGAAHPLPPSASPGWAFFG
jgi:hypothetical protein